MSATALGHTTVELAQAQLEAAHQRWKDAWLAGPTRLSWTTPPVQVGDPAPRIEVTDSDKATFPLARAWERGPALVIFLRHFGCSCTWRRLERLATETARYRDLGASVCAVGQAEAERTRLFACEREVTVPLLCDPERAAYHAFGVLEGQPPQIVYTNDLDGQPGIDLADDLARQGRYLVDSPWQLGAEFIVATTGVVALAHRYQCCDDFPPTELLTATLERANEAG
jgi:peroxiredoxin